VCSVDYADTDVKLPELREVVINVTLSEHEREVYSAFLSKAQHVYHTKSIVCVFEMLTRLRQVSIAPFIVCDDSKRKRSRNRLLNAELDQPHAFCSNILDRRVHGLESSKIHACVELLNTIHSKMALLSLFELAIRRVDKTHLIRLRQTMSLPCIPVKKTIVFSMFVSALDLLVDAIASRLPHLSVLQIDGDTPHKNDVFIEFKTSVFQTVMLTTYKVAAEGFNITEATNCILLDPWWNNATTKQATGRLWRIGQTSPVTVYKLVTMDTVEQRVLKLCKEKDKMIESFMAGTKHTSKITKRQIHSLLF
jgi:SNF2 family DNA or RNA helicase